MKALTALAIIAALIVTAGTGYAAIKSVAEQEGYHETLYANAIEGADTNNNLNIHSNTFVSADGTPKLILKDTGGYSDYSGDIEFGYEYLGNYYPRWTIGPETGGDSFQVRRGGNVYAEIDYKGVKGAMRWCPPKMLNVAEHSSGENEWLYYWMCDLPENENVIIIQHPIVCDGGRDGECHRIASSSASDLCRVFGYYMQTTALGGSDTVSQSGNYYYISTNTASPSLASQYVFDENSGTRTVVRNLHCSPTQGLHS